MTEIDLESLLRNWARWTSDRGYRKKHCYSAEGRYRSPQHWHPPEPRQPEIDLHSAIKVERIIVRLPIKYKILLLGHYVRYSNPRAICRKLAIRPSDYEGTLQMAKLMVRNNLNAAAS